MFQSHRRAGRALASHVPSLPSLGTIDEDACASEVVLRPPAAQLQVRKNTLIDLGYRPVMRHAASSWHSVSSNMSETA